MTRHRRLGHDKAKCQGRWVGGLRAQERFACRGRWTTWTAHRWGVWPWSFAFRRLVDTLVREKSVESED